MSDEDTDDEREASADVTPIDELEEQARRRAERTAAKLDEINAAFAAGGSSADMLPLLRGMDREELERVFVYVLMELHTARAIAGLHEALGDNDEPQR